MDKHKNFAQSAVATAPSPATSGLSLTVTSGDGVKFPVPPFNATVRPALVAPTTANAEIVRVTGITGDVLTLVRSQESTSPRTIIVGDQIAATVTAKTVTDVENAFGTQRFRGLRLRTHYNQDISSRQVALTGLDEITMNDGSRYQPESSLLPLAADITNAGVSGLDTGAEGASTWYEIYLIGKSSTQATSDLRVMFHKAKNYVSDTFFSTSDTSRALRRATGTATDRLAQGVQFVTANPLIWTSVIVQRQGAVSGRVWLSLQADSAGNPSGTPLVTSDKLDAGGLATVNTLVRFPFRVPFTPVAGTQYHLVMEGDYTRSDTVNVLLYGAAAGGYASGSAKEFNGATWAAMSGVGDVTFELVMTYNDTALTMPSGYDQYCKIGYVFNNSSSDFVPFTAFEKTVRSLTSVGSGWGSISATQPIAISLASVLPPQPVEVFTQASNTIQTFYVQLLPMPDGFSPGTTAPGEKGSIVINAPGANYLFDCPPLYTELQAAYAVVNGGVGTIYTIGYRW